MTQLLTDDAPPTTTDDAKEMLYRAAGRRDIDQQKTIALYLRLLDMVVGSNALALAHLGSQVGLFDALVAGACDATTLATRTGLHARYVREWANAMVASELIEFDPERGEYSLSPEQQVVFAVDGFPSSGGGLVQLAVGIMNNVAPMIDHFRDGTGMPYADLPEDIPIGIGRLWAGVHHMQMPLWFLAMPELRARLAGGGAIADVGCGRGRSSVELARVFPGCTVLGIDNDPASIGAARDLAAARGVTDRVVFAEADAEVLDRPGEFDLIYAFCTIHDMGSPAAALARLRRSLKPDGLLVWVETTASDDPMENRWGPGRLFATVSPLYNLPAAIANGGEGLGTFLSVEHARRLATDAGFATFDELPTESAFISVFLLRP